jgi:hypothetical protein
MAVQDAQRANLCTKGTGPICRLPLLTFTYQTRGCSPWGPEADYGTVKLSGFSDTGPVPYTRFKTKE